jgi:BirA family transcriptional regulator, biotin operon repressor / biotin---[acetyl-CoA-carboxylase] ligase
MLALAATGSVNEGDWLIAERQTAGRGRQGREWASPPGNLYASGLVELRPNDPPPPTLALVAGLAVAEVLGMSRVWLKWPNDVLAASAKLAGILLERQNDAVVIGVGVNLAHHPDLPDRPTMSLAALGVTMSADTAISVLAPTFARWLGIWRTDRSLAIRTAWLHRAHPIGTPLSAALPDSTRLDGVFDGLTDDCALRLKLPDATTRVIHAGDVFLI